MLQPATKALAQMLAGRAGVSGQLNHARNLLAHAERLINDRVHNRLIPAEREEFLEQLARLRLTLADADAEAEVQAAEEQVEKAPPRPVAHERLKEMALALSRPERQRVPPARPAEDSEMPGSEPAAAAGDQAVTAGAPGEESQPSPAKQEEPRPLRPLADLPGRLVLSKSASDRARSAIAEPVSPSAGRRPRQPAPGAAGPAEAAAGDDGEQNAPAPSTAAAAGNGAAVSAERRTARRSRKTKDGLPEGWVIDDEGYVVPRQS